MQQYKDVRTRTMEIPQRTRILEGYHSLKVHNAHFKLVSPISGLNVKPNGTAKLQASVPGLTQNMII